MKKQLVMTTAMAAALAGLPACSSNDGWNEDVIADRDTAICVDRQGERVDDDRCGGDRYRGPGLGSAFLWYYIGRSAAVPYYGDSIHDRRYQRYARYNSFAPQPGRSYAEAPASRKSW